MRLTTLQGKFLAAYSGYHGARPTVLRVLKSFLPSHMILVFGIAIWIAAVSLAVGNVHLCYLGAGTVIGMIFRDLQNAIRFVNVWPALEQIVDWPKLESIVNDDGTTVAQGN